MSKHAIAAELVEESVLWLFGGKSSRISFEQLGTRLEAHPSGARITQAVNDPRTISGLENHLAAEADRKNPNYIWKGGDILIEGLAMALSRAIEPHLLPGTVPPPTNQLERLAASLMSNPNYVEDLKQAAQFGTTPTLQTPKKTFLDAIDLASLRIPLHKKRSPQGDLAKDFSERKDRKLDHNPKFGGREL